MTHAEHRSEFVFTKGSPYLVLTGDVLRTCWENRGEYWPRYNDTTLYLRNDASVCRHCHMLASLGRQITNITQDITRSFILYSCHARACSLEGLQNLFHKSVSVRPWKFHNQIKFSKYVSHANTFYVKFTTNNTENKDDYIEGVWKLVLLLGHFFGINRDISNDQVCTWNYIKIYQSLRVFLYNEAKRNGRHFCRWHI